LDAVIGLPANIFYGTSIPTCIMVFKKCKENPGDVLFIDASQHFEKSENSKCAERRTHQQNLLTHTEVDWKKRNTVKKLTLQLISRKRL